MNGQIIRYLALNGSSLIYSVAKDLASRSQNKVHYPTVNRRIHELVRREYIEKAGTRTTKAGIAADLYTTTIRGDFAALAGILDSNGKNVEMSPKEIRQVIANASLRKGSPFALLGDLLEEGQTAVNLVDEELVPEIIRGVRSGYLNLDALDTGVICSIFSSLVARTVTSISSSSGRSKETESYYKILIRSLEKMMASAHGKGKELQEDKVQQKLQLTPIASQWGNELKVFLRLHSVRFG
jgi:hypothetical protein